MPSSPTPFLTGTLPSGLRYIQLPTQSEVAYCGIAIHAGTRHETPCQQGLAHFCEHLSFKGTHRRSAVQIINAIEGLGGELNAFTNKEDTVFYCAIQRRHLRKALDVLTDIVFHSQFPQHEVEKECEVVCDEIESYEDSPAELIYDEFENILFTGHPLGHNILGTSSQVRSYTSTDALAFTQQWYQPQNCVLFISSDAKVTSFLKPLTQATAPNSSSEASQRGVQFDAVSGANTITRHRGTHQAHVMLGTRAYAASDPRRWALYLLSNILGGPGLNSRLNMALRERRGLVYTVESTMTSYSDTGIWTVYFGCDQHDVDRCLRLTRRELDLLMEKPLSPLRLRAAKRQLQGQLAIACDNREQFVLDVARTFLHTGRQRTLADVMTHIEQLTADDLLLVARELFNQQVITTLIYT